MKKSAFLILLVLICATTPSYAEESESVKTEAVKTGENSKTNIGYNVSNKNIERIAAFDAKTEITFNGTKHLVLQYSAHGRKVRGNILLLHAEGESPMSDRLIQPLTNQLTHLGWSVYIPNIAIEDYPKPKNLPTNDTPQDAEADQSKTDDELENLDSKKEFKDDKFYFKSSTAYQEYFSQLCTNLQEQTDIAKQSTIVIANQNSAYWSLDCLEKAKAISAIVFLRPLLPKSVKNDLEEKFTRQSVPVFSFKTDDQVNDTFDKMFKKRIWNTKFQRFNIGMLSRSRLHIEDNAIARSITGWIEKQRKN